MCVSPGDSESCRFVQRGDSIVGGDRIEQVTGRVAVGLRQGSRRDHEVLPSIRTRCRVCPCLRALVD
ncbi:hypothetical protein FM103_08655 [Corynebacterium xerosis]|nr:hypothetical protein FM103_08655 [Corynebacterium xerosis]